MSEDFIPCERTVRLCIEALPRDERKLFPGDIGYEQWNIKYGYHQWCRQSLQALLPDPAKALVEEFAGENAAMSREFADGAYWAIKRLIVTGRIRSGE